MIDRRAARATQIAVLLCADAVIAALVLLAGGGEPVLDLLAAGAAAGVVIAAPALTAVLARSRRLADTALLLAWLRLIAVPVAVAAIAVHNGADTVIGLVETVVVALAFLDALAGLAAGVTANRYARR